MTSLVETGLTPAVQQKQHSADSAGRRPLSTVVFHRNFQRFQGGHLKVFHYFQHVRSSPSHNARIHFSADSVWDETNPWLDLRETVIDAQDSGRADVLFLAGMDWRTLAPAQRGASQVPLVNLIQDFRPTRAAAQLHEFIVHPAIRICISAEIQQALESTGAVRGPLFTVPVGIDLERLPAPRLAHERDLDCAVLAVKDPDLGGAIAESLAKGGNRVLLVDRPMPREQLLATMARARVAVLLPASVEGAYMPALECMALGALVVCPDCVGNRSFCRDGETCLVPKRSRRAIVKAARAVLAASAQELEPMLAAAREVSVAHGLNCERTKFLEILDRVDELWASC
jgi:glycosyltransferase involved in cell wall biosynthesis